MTYDEETEFMVNYPHSEELIWDGHKNNPRQNACQHPVLSALEKASLLRHLIRRGELQMRRLRHTATRIVRAMFRLDSATLQKFLAYVI